MSKTDVLVKYGCMTARQTVLTKDTLRRLAEGVIRPNKLKTICCDKYRVFTNVTFGKHNNLYGFICKDGKGCKRKKKTE